MARFCSPEWVAAFNELVGDLADVTSVGTTGPGGADVGPKRQAAGGESRFRVAQVLTDAPGGDFQMVLEVDRGRLHLEREDLPHSEAPEFVGPRAAGPDAEEPDVAVVLSYQDAAALSRGEVDAAQLIASGRLRVRGNLSLLVAGQALITAAGERLARLSASTTY